MSNKSIFDNIKLESIWLSNYNDSYETLNEDITCDVLIIGGGITGLTTLYNLKDSNLNVILVDASLIAHGLSGHTTGKINYLQELIYSDILKEKNYDTAKMYYESQIDAIKYLKNTIKKEKIACDFKKVESFVYTDKEDDIKDIVNEKDLLTSFGANIKEYHGKILYANNLYAIRALDTYVFHPVKYLLNLKKICLKFKRKIYENTKIFDIKKSGEYYNCYTDKHIIKAKKIVLANHYPYFLFPYFLPIKTNIEKSYIIAAKDKWNALTYITSKNPCQSVRYFQNYLIYLSNSTNISDNLDEQKNYEKVIDDIKKYGLKVNYAWKNDDLITLDKIPYIGYIKDGDNTILIGTGFNTWGMTNGTLAGIILSDLIVKGKSKYQTLCDPLRVSNIKNIDNKFVNLFDSAKGYLKSKINKDKDWYHNITFQNINGENIAIYKEGNIEYKVYNRCPHMGCSLIFNEVDKTWDCPCHASRFTIDGHCLKGPSNKDITYK